MSKRKIPVVSKKTGKNKKQHKTFFYIAGSIAIFAAAWTILPHIMQYYTGMLYKLTCKHSLAYNKKPGLPTKKKYK